MEKFNLPIKNVKPLLLSLMMGYLVTILGVLLIAFILLQFQISEKTVDIGIILLYIISSFVAGFIIGKKMQSRKFMWGLATGLCYFSLLLIISIIMQKQLETNPREILTIIFICAGSGMLGGMVS